MTLDIDMSKAKLTSLIKRAAERGDPTSVGEELLTIAGFTGATIKSYDSLVGGNPEKSRVFRVGTTGDAGALSRAIVKVPAELSTDRESEAESGVYARELEVYNLLRDMQGGFQPRIFAALYDPDSRTAALLIEDLGELPNRGEFVPGVIRRGLVDLAHVHSRYWGDESLCANWWMRDGYRADIFDEDVEQFAPNWEMLDRSAVLHPYDTPTVNGVAEFLAENILDVLQELDDRPRTLTHGDLHTANMMLRRTDSPPTPVLIDWQDAVYSGASSDVAKFLSTTISPEVARRHFDGFVADYYSAMRPDIRSTYSFSAFRRDIMLALLGTFANYVISVTTSFQSDVDPKSLNSSLRRVSSVIDVVRPLDEL